MKGNSQCLLGGIGDSLLFFSSTEKFFLCKYTTIGSVFGQGWYKRITTGKTGRLLGNLSHKTVIFLWTVVHDDGRKYSKQIKNEEDIYTIGDGYSDIEMIKRFDGYAMENAVNEVKKYAIKEYPSVSNLIEDILEEKI